MVKEILFQSNILKFSYRILHWHLKYMLDKKPSPLSFGFFITSKCNFKCKFCNIWRIKPFVVSQEEAEKVIKELGKLGLIYFSFTGGEPLLVPYIFDLLAYARESGILYTHLVSNGYLVDRNKARKLAEADVSEISFSLDGEEEIHDKQRGIKGAYRKVIEAVEHVQTHAPKTKIVLNTILDPNNPENALFAVEKAKELGVMIKLQPSNDHPSFDLQDCAEKSRGLLQLETRQRLLEAIERLQEAPHVVSSKPFLENYKNYLFNQDNLIFAKDDCIYGYHHVEFFKKLLFPCLEGMNWEKGFDMSGRSIQETQSSENYCRKLQELRKCSACRTSFYICYYEPRLNFPIWNLIKSRVQARITTDFFCPVCGLSKYKKFMRRDGANYVRCRSCGLEAIFPYPEDVTYQQDYYESWGGETEAAETSILKQKTAGVALDYLKGFEGKKLLEVGCAKGDLVKEAVARGYSVTGIDINKYAIEVALKRGLKAEFYNYELVDLLKLNKSYDFVVMVDVIEHVKDPNDFLKYVNTGLRKGGILLLVTPDLANIRKKLMGKGWLHYKKEHFYYYSLKHLRMLLERAGFKVLKSDSMLKCLNLRYIDSQLRTCSNLFCKMGLFLLRFVKNTGSYRKPFRLNDGELIIVAQKEKEL